MQESIVLCEFHDAVLASISIDASFTVEIRFAHIACYHATQDPAIAEIWLAPARIIVNNMDRISLECPDPHTVRVYDVEVDNAEDMQIDKHNLRLLRGVTIRSIKVLFDTGASINIEGGVAQLILESKGRYLESFDWEPVR